MLVLSQLEKTSLNALVSGFYRREMSVPQVDDLDVQYVKDIYEEPNKSQWAAFSAALHQVHVQHFLDSLHKALGPYISTSKCMEATGNLLINLTEVIVSVGSFQFEFTLCNSHFAATSYSVSNNGTFITAGWVTDLRDFAFGTDSKPVSDRDINITERFTQQDEIQLLRAVINYHILFSAGVL